MKIEADKANGNINESLRSIQSNMHDIEHATIDNNGDIKDMVEIGISRFHDVLSWTELTWRVIIISTMIFGCYHIFSQRGELGELNYNLATNNAILLTNKAFWYDEKNHKR